VSDAKHPAWTDADHAFLRRNYGSMSCAELAAELGRTPTSVKSRIAILKLRKRRRFTPAEIDLIRRLYPEGDTNELARTLGRSVSSIYTVISRLGLKKSEAWRAEELQRQGGRLRKQGKATRFPKGHVPANKGKRRPGYAVGRMAETQFKKGHRTGRSAELYQPIGTERVTRDGYRQRKVNDDLPFQARWKLVQRIVWEEHHGPIPEGMVIAFRDGDKLNCAIENLDLITLAELMARNTFHNYPEPLKAMIHTMAGFRRRLNNYAKKQDSGSEEHALRNDGAAAR
jgi:hypothetical protein